MDYEKMNQRALEEMEEERETQRQVDVLTILLTVGAAIGLGMIIFGVVMLNS